MATHPIHPRQIDFRFDDTTPTWWFDGDVFKTLLLMGLSCSFPEGERFFVRAVRQFQDRITDPVLRKQVRAFIGQEAHHGNEHQELNAFMASRGLPTAQVEARVKKGLAFEARILSPERQLAMTCALEHFTAMFAELLLKHPDFFEGMDSRVLALWTWHAIEESEHKAVAFDVYQQAVGSHWIRTSQMAITTLTFAFFTGLHFATLYRAGDYKLGVRGIAKGLGYFFGPKGWLNRTLPRYLAYYRRDFHPDRSDSSEAREHALRWLAEQLGRPELAA
jgi:predicted metal-dependent hydrolase